MGWGYWACSGMWLRDCGTAGHCQGILELFCSFGEVNYTNEQDEQHLVQSILINHMLLVIALRQITCNNTVLFEIIVCRCEKVQMFRRVLFSKNRDIREKQSYFSFLCNLLLTFYSLLQLQNSSYLHSISQLRNFLVCQCGVEKTSRIVGGAEVSPVRLKYFSWKIRNFLV